MNKVVDRDDALHAAAWGHRIVAVDMDNNVNIRLLDMVPEKYIYLDLDAEEENKENPAQVKATLHELQLQEEAEEEKPKESPVIKIPSESKNTKFDIDLDKLKAELKNGTSIKKIAVLFGCSDQTIYNTMHRHGIAFDGYPERVKK
jgi:hypothetical protein